MGITLPWAILGTTIFARRCAPRRDASRRLYRARTNRVSRYAKPVTDQNKIESNASLLLVCAYISREIYMICIHASIYKCKRSPSSSFHLSSSFSSPRFSGVRLFSTVHPPLFFFHIDHRSWQQPCLIPLPLIAISCFGSPKCPNIPQKWSFRNYHTFCSILTLSCNNNEY